MFRGYIIAVTDSRNNLGLVLSGKLFKTMTDVKNQQEHIAKGLPNTYNIWREEVDSDCYVMKVWIGGQLFAGYKSFPIYC